MRKHCDRVPYATSEEAKAALARVRARRGGGKKKRERRTYKCRRCGFWHTTSMSK